MENINTLLFKTLTQISKESRLVFEVRRPGTTPPPRTGSRPAPATGTRPAATPARPGTRPAAGREAAGAKPKGTEAEPLKADPKALKAKFDSMKTKWIGMVSAKHTAEFKATIQANIKQLDAKLKLVLRGKLDAKKVKEFTDKIQILEKKAKVAQILDKKRRELLNPKKLEEARKQIVKGVMDKLKVPGPLQATVEASINTSLGEIQSRIQKLLSGLATGLSQAADEAIGTFAAKIAKLPAQAPTSIQDVLKVLGHYPDINKMTKEILEYVEAVKIVIDKNHKHMKEFLGTCEAVERCKEALKEWYTTAAGWLKDPKTMPKGAKLVEAILKAQSKIIMAQVIGWLEKKKPQLLQKLKDLLKKVPGALKRGVDINIDAMLRFLQNYASFASTGAETKRKIAQILAKAISVVTPPLQVNMVVEGGADSQAITLSNSPGLVAGYKKFQGVAKRLLPLIKAKKGLGNLPQIQGHAKAIEAYANGGDPYTFLMKVTKNKKDKAAMEKWMGGGGVLNTLLFVSRSEDMAGEIGSTDNLYDHKNCVVGGYATSTGRAKRGDRFSRVSFLAKNSKLRQSSTPSKPAKKPLTPKQKAALKLKDSKDKLKASKDKATAAKKAATDAITAIKKNPKLDPDNSQLKAKFKEIEDKIKQIDDALKPLPGTATLAQINARKAKIDKLIGELNKLVADLNKLKDKLLATKVPTKVPTIKPGKKGEYLGVKFKRTPDGKFVIVGGSPHKLTEKEFKIVAGVERPDEAYKKKKVELSYIRKDLPAKISYDAATKVITGSYKDRAGNEVKVTYNIKTGERKVTLAGGTLRPLLDPDAKKAAKMAIISAAFADGLDVSSISVVDDPAEAALKELKEHLVAGNYMEALKILVAQPKKDIKVIRECVQMLAPTSPDWTQVDSRQLSPLLPQIIQNYTRDFRLEDFNAFIAIMGSTPNIKVIEAVAASDKLKGATNIGAIFSVIMLTPAYAKNKIVARNFIERAFVHCHMAVTNDNIALAINAYDGDWEKAPHDVMKFIVDNFTNATYRFDKPVFRPKAIAYLTATDFAALPPKYKDLFKKLYTDNAAIEGDLAKKPYGPELWVKYMKSKAIDNLMDSGIDRLFSVAGGDAIKFIDKWLDMDSTITEGTVNAGDVAKAGMIVKKLSASKSPLTIELVEDLLVLIKGHGALPADLQPAERAQQQRIKDSYAVAVGTKPTSYENRIKALEFFIPGGVYHGKDAPGAPASGTRDKALKTKLAEVHYDNEKFDATTIPADLLALLPKPKREFIGYFRNTATLDEPGMDMIRDKRNIIGVDAIRVLADKLARGGGNSSRALRLYKMIGMNEKAAEMLHGVSNAAEKQFLKTLLDHVNKPFDKMNDKEKRTALKELRKAYELIRAASTDDNITLRIVDQLLKLSPHMGQKSERLAILNLLDNPSSSVDKGHLNRVAEKRLPKPLPARLNAAQKLILKARRLRAQVEMDQYKEDPGLVSLSDLKQMTADLDQYHSVIKKALDKKDAETLAKIYKQHGENLNATQRQAYARLMLQAAEKHGTPDKYFKYGHANLDLKEGDFPDAKDKVRFFLVQKQYLKAVAHETRTAKQVEYIQKASRQPGADKNKIAQAYESIKNEAAQVEAVKIYIELGKTNRAKLAEAARIIKNPSGPKVITPGTARNIIKNRMPKIQLTVDVAESRGFHDAAFDTYEKATNPIKIKATTLTSLPASYNNKIINELAKANKTVEGTTAEKNAVKTRIQALPAYTTHPQRGVIDRKLR